MNTQEILKILAEYFSGFIFHESFLKELYDILRKNVSGKEKQLFKQLATQLANIRNMGRMVYMADDNERLLGGNGHYYSIHLTSSQYNIRLLICIVGQDTPYFLCAFYERAGKSRTSYGRYIPVLDRRFSQLLGDDDDE